MKQETKQEIAEKMMIEMLDYEVKNAKASDLKNSVTRFMVRRITQMYDECKGGDNNDIQED